MLARTYNQGIKNQVSAYITLLQESEANFIKLIDNPDVKDSRRDYGPQHVVSKTCQISFNQIRSSDPEASDLLALTSMFYRRGTPEFLLRQNMTQFNLKMRLSVKGLPLIKEKQDKQFFEIRRLIQLSIRKWLESNNQLQLWTRTSAKIIAATPQSGQVDTWKKFQLLIPHAKEIMRQAPKPNKITIVPDGNFGWISKSYYGGQLKEHELAGIYSARTCIEKQWRCSDIHSKIVNKYWVWNILTRLKISKIPA
ncbi:hypothetical protein BDV29DRAFT_130072 [Aspergillus leporis]|jgi:hypothetical protein|uniref:Uncharacterized protein n=1 Tax=Aspergillus leporis TaxID=41062 RepID=A0A5N5XFA8_9EURO|nr:hypothetical protein BDV29DRAFT_130072 [Aspergillus leporis]